MQDPQRYLNARNVALPCAVDSSRAARIEPGLCAFVNHEVFFFSDSVALDRFRKQPLRYCGLVTDPVSRARFRPTAKSAHMEYRERPYYFQSQADLEKFAAMPDSFANRRGM